MYGWGIQVREMIGLYTESKCWRCLSETVGEEDELGLCDLCIASLQDSPRSRTSAPKARKPRPAS